MHFVHLNFNSLLPRIEEIHRFSVLFSVFNIEVVIEGYDRSRKIGGVSCFIKHSAAYNYKASIGFNTESIFTEISKPKPFKAGILYRPSDKIDFVNCISQIFSQFYTLETSECYLLGNFNAKSYFAHEKHTTKIS